jgi:hypothetical protein
MCTYLCAFPFHSLYPPPTNAGPRGYFQFDDALEQAAQKAHTDFLIHPLVPVKLCARAKKPSVSCEKMVWGGSERRSMGGGSGYCTSQLV